MVAKISISIPDAALLEWAKQQAEREGRSLSAVFTEALRRERQRDARLRVEQWLGSAGELTPEREAEVLAEWGVPPTSAPLKPKPAQPRAKRVPRKRAR
jgi:hypothetical protein